MSLKFNTRNDDGSWDWRKDALTDRQQILLTILRLPDIWDLVSTKEQTELVTTLAGILDDFKIGAIE